MTPEFHGKVKDGIFYYNNFKVFLLYAKGLKDGDYYATLQKVKGSPKTLEQLGYFHAVVVPTCFKQINEDHGGKCMVSFEVAGGTKKVPLTEEMVVEILKDVWAKYKKVKVKSKADMTKAEASELISISIEWAARYLHCSIPEPNSI